MPQFQRAQAAVSAEIQPAQGGAHTSTDTLNGQFLLGGMSLADRAPAGWNRAQHGQWILAAHPSLPVVKIQSNDSGTCTGWIIGWAIDEDGLIRNDFHPATKTTFTDLENWLCGLSGRFAAIIFLNGEERFYLDASGSLATVYSPQQKLVGSTPSTLAIALGEEAAYRKLKSSQPGLPANHFYPGDITGDPNVRRILPNHYLDLKTFQPHRHWPTEQISRADEFKALKLAQGIADNTRHCIESLAQVYPLVAGLSAGRDSRMLLACSRNVLSRIEWVTFDYKDPAKFADVHIAQKLAATMKLNYRVLDLIDPPKDMKADYLFRIGYTNNSGKTCDFYDACYRQIDMKRVWLVGYGGEVGRSFYWKPGDEDKLGRQLDCADLLKRMNLPTDTARLEAMQRWQASLPADLDAYMLLDLMYQELRLGCWASPQIYGAAPFAANIMPLSSLQNYAAMMAMPTAYRINQGLAQDVIQYAWARLLMFPFQALTGWRNWMRALRRRLAG